MAASHVPAAKERVRKAKEILGVKGVAAGNHQINSSTQDEIGHETWERQKDKSKIYEKGLPGYTKEHKSSAEGM